MCGENGLYFGCGTVDGFVEMDVILALVLALVFWIRVLILVLVLGVVIMDMMSGSMWIL